MPAVFKGPPGRPGDKQCEDVSNEIRRGLDEVRDDFAEVEGINYLDLILARPYLQHCIASGREVGSGILPTEKSP